MRKLSRSGQPTAEARVQSRASQVGFVLDKVALEQTSVLVLQVSSVSVTVTSPALRTRPFTHLSVAKTL
jgi:hypothetical protein